MISTEQLIIAILLSPGEVYNDVIHKLTIGHFTEELPAKCYRTILKAAEKKLQITPITLRKEAEGQISMSEITEVMGWLSQLTYNEPIEQLIDQVSQAFIKRRYEALLTDLITTPQIGVDPSEIVSNAIVKLTNLVEQSSTEDETITMLDLMDEERKAYYRREELAKQGKISGKTTGIEALDKYTGGWQNEIIIIGARPGMGKTATALFFAKSMNEPGILFNMEMGRSQLAQRFILQNANDSIHSSSLRDGKLSTHEQVTFEKTIGYVEKLPFTIYDKGGCGVNEAIRVIKREHRKGKCNWVIIDYLQLMTLEGSKGTNREQEISKMSKMLKSAQKQLGIPFIVLSQLSRKPEERPDKMPQLSDLRESGTIEQDADSVVLLYRPGYYKLNNPETNEPYTNEIYTIFGKHRMGATGTVGFRHNQSMSSFYGMNDIESGELKPLNNLTPNRNFYEKDSSDDQPF